VTDASSPETLRSWDSLSHLDLISEIEEAYDVRFSTGDILKAKSVAAVRRLLREKGLEVD
jgi:acyl carrier protein